MNEPYILHDRWFNGKLDPKRREGQYSVPNKINKTGAQKTTISRNRRMRINQDTRQKRQGNVLSDEDSNVRGIICHMEKG